MPRTVTSNMLQLRVDWLNKALNRPLDMWQPNPNGTGTIPNAGNFHLEHSNGGYRIEEQKANGCPNATFGSSRMSKGDLLNMIEAMLVAIDLAKRLAAEERKGAANVP